METWGFRFNVSLLLVLVLVVPTRGARANGRADSLDWLEQFVTKPADNGTRWAILVAGSQGYINYRHQADVCHAYQILKKGGLKDENIVVFMYDDIAYNAFNPWPGIIINRPDGHNVYAGVPKDYTGENVTVQNFFAVLQGHKKAVKGGSGKVVDSKPQDRIFLYYTDHGGDGILAMPNPPYLLANDLVGNLTKKHKAGGYKEMVIYVEACEAGSMFEGLLPENVNIYATTASNAHESSYGTYCDNKDGVCYGDLFSVSWMEDSETHNCKKETLGLQYDRVKERTYANGKKFESSHVMEYGNKSMKGEKLYLYQGFDPASEKVPPNNILKPDDEHMNTVNQRDIDLLFMWHRYKKANSGSENKAKVLEELKETMKLQFHLDGSMEMIGMLLFGPQKGPSILGSSRQPGSPVVDDWECLKSMVRVFEDHCGSLTQHGLKHMRGFANICNNGVSKNAMEEACIFACNGYDSGLTHPSVIGYSA